MPEKDISSIFTNNLKKLLADNNMTYRELSEKLGVKASSISMWMNGNSLPRMGLLDKLADLFNVSVEYLITNKEKKQGYYLNEETAKLAQEMFEDEDMRSLFDMKRDMPPERFKAHIEFMKNLYNQEKGNTNE
ncbi:helix-turn-helix domain-containing protein [Parablautia intestinalis]|uniref:helix-turn-helix domain-containing protein n=1 Tax=Parablautia intestinalis TaxID=2320100 RepID=UPI00256E9D25|nr:helix-turn-helix transcriptional regulator [Parablautia intestinalis]